MDKLNKNEYKCAVCENVYEKGWSDKEARDEYESVFQTQNHNNCEVVCDDCYKKMRSEYPVDDFLKDQQSEELKRDQLSEITRKVDKILRDNPRIMGGYKIDSSYALSEYYQMALTKGWDKEVTKMMESIESFADVSDIGLGDSKSFKL